ncbi:MAG: radical SAM protein, partial [Chitinivibrionales bacterium]
MLSRDMAEQEPENRKRVEFSRFRGEFLKRCPGTTADYICCGYNVLSPVIGCGMYCTYCILQAYHGDSMQHVCTNFDDLEEEVHQKIQKRGGVYRIGTGEFADSLYLEDRTGIASRVVEVFNKYDNVLLELKTKSVNVTDKLMRDTEKPYKVIISFSMNTPEMVDHLERDTASIDQRLDMAAEVVKRGFYTAFHFDPMIYHKGWKEGYQDLVKRIFDRIREPDRIAWWSMGGFRSVPALKRHLRRYRSHLSLFSGEMVLGRDNKYRYIRPIRVGFYSTILEQIQELYPET